jgi:uncharacterized zinc-type alcohol dehydrogenase-like protein
MKVQGYASQQAKAPLTPYSFERRETRDHDVVIDIQYCGIRHTDIHQVRDEWGASTFPMVPGHEIAGVVTGIGSRPVIKWAIGWLSDASLILSFGCIIIMTLHS